MSKHLSLQERIIIERMIGQGFSFATIARQLERSPSTIAREIQHYRCFVDRIPLPGENDCTSKNFCKRNNVCPDSGFHGCYGYRCSRCPDNIRCFETCDVYESSHCSKLDKPPYVCTKCKERQKCKKNHAYYTAHRANAAHLSAIKEAHSGIRKSPEELKQIGNLIKPLIQKGQSLNHICTTHADELGICERTLYNYIDNNVFDVRNIDLPKKVVYRQRRARKTLTRIEYQYRKGRTYEDFKSFMEANPHLPVVEMDTVKGGRQKGKVFLTMIFRQSSFMLIFLMKDGTQQSVLAVFDALTELLGHSLFSRLFPVILTDNGVEFKDPNGLEHTRNGIPRTRVFFCDPQASWQKPQVENNHKLVRRILPKGTTLNNLSIANVTLITCHINSVLREHLGGKTPFELMQSEDEKNCCLRLTFHRFHPTRLL